MLSIKTISLSDLNVLVSKSSIFQCYWTKPPIVWGQGEIAAPFHFLYFLYIIAIWIEWWAPKASRSQTSYFFHRRILLFLCVCGGCKMYSMTKDHWNKQSKSKYMIQKFLFINFWNYNCISQSEKMYKYFELFYG